MSSDYKDRIMEKAEEIAWEKYDQDFYSLTEDQRDEIYTAANQYVAESYI